MARYRLRLLLQEFDLPPGETLLGRSPECHVTIDDPLVSREHARIEVRDDRATIRDLSSRNGLKVNSAAVSGEIELRDGDRVRIGNQDLLFSRVTAPTRPGRPTGSLRHCRRCATPYPAESPSCPNCGFSPSNDDTLSGTMAAREALAAPLDRENWSLKMHLELIDRALALFRLDDADRAVKRMAESIEERLTAGAKLDLATIAPAYERAVRLAVAKGAAEWIGWVFTLALRIDVAPTALTLAMIEQAPPSAIDGANEPIATARARWGEAPAGATRAALAVAGKLVAIDEAVRTRRAARAAKGG